MNTTDLEQKSIGIHCVACCIDSLLSLSTAKGGNGAVPVSTDYVDFVYLGLSKRGEDNGVVMTSENINNDVRKNKGTIETEIQWG